MESYPILTQIKKVKTLSSLSIFHFQFFNSFISSRSPAKDSLLNAVFLSTL